jgi:hypothetical protein
MNWKILSLALLVIACEHTPKGTYYVDLNRETFGNININLLNQPDTILLLQETNFNYSVKLQEGQVIRNIDITVDGKLISNTNSAYSTFSLIPGQYETGFHVLKAEVMTTTGTGSMSDLAGAETLLYTREWIIIVDHTPPAGLKITNIAEFNGKLRIEWTKNSSLNFKHYLVYRILYNPFTHSSNEMGLAMISDPDSNWYVDDSYIGGQVTYRIENVSMNLTIPGIPGSYEGSYPTILSAQKTDVDKVKFTWNRTRFPGNLGKYEITVKDKINLTFTSLYTTVNPDDTSYTATLCFGDTIDFWLNTIPQKVNYWYPETMSDRIAAYAGEKIPRHMSRLVHSNDPEIVYLVDHNSISRYNVTTGETELTVETGYNDWERRNIFISPDGKYLVRFSDNVADLIDPVSLSAIRSIQLSQFFTSSNPLRINYVSNNGWMSVSKDEWPYKAGIVDLENSDTLFTVKNINPLTIYPSPSGKYIIINDSWISTLYNYDGGLTKLYDLGSDVFEFNPVNEEEVYRFSTTHDNSISLLKCSDRQVVKSYIPSMGLGIQDVDPVSGLIMIYGYSVIYILDLDQKSIVTTRKISELIPWQQYAFFNNTLFSGLGYKLSLKP